MGVRDRLAPSAGRCGRPRPAVAAAAIGLAGLVSVAGLADCGRAAATGQPAPAGSAGTAGSAGSMSQVSAGSGTLCADAAAVDRLTVIRLDAIPANHPHFSFPAAVPVSDATKARIVAQALCALRPMPHATFACPADLGISYQLDFAVPGRSLPRATIRAGGCEEVSGGGLAIRWAVGTPTFWTVLGRAMGLANPGHAAFAGTIQP
jgi:hypothetical protein